MTGRAYSMVALFCAIDSMLSAGASACPRGTLDILREAGLDPIAAELEPLHVPQATITNWAVMARGRELLSSKNVCEDEDWRKKSLKLVREIPIAGVLGTLQEETKFEASGIARRGNNQYVIACDNTRSLPCLNDRLQFKSNVSWLIRDSENPAQSAASLDSDNIRGSTEVAGINDSQFEGITYLPRSDHMLVVKELVRHEGHYHPVVQELEFAKDNQTYRTMLNCTVNFKLTHDNKGFEGIQFHEDANGEKWLMGLCEGNFCSGGKHGRKKGHGRIVVSKFYQDEDLGVCGWEPVKVIKIPKTAYFADYSDMAFRGNRLAITSQEESEVWIGEFDKEKMEFASEGSHYHFPRSDSCEQIYCNIEGVEWIDDDRLMLASDRSKADQPYICTRRDQSVHIMVLPHGHREVNQHLGLTEAATQDSSAESATA